MQEFSTLFEGIGIAVPTTVAFTGSGEPEQIQAAGASGDFFSVMNVNAAEGRLIEPDDDVPGATPVAVLSDGFWQRRFGGDPSILGQTIYTNGIPLTVVGVLPPDFTVFHPGSNFPEGIDVCEVAPVCGQLGGLFKVYSGCRSSCQNLLGSIFLSPLLRRWVSGQGA